MYTIDMSLSSNRDGFSFICHYSFVKCGKMQIHYRLHLNGHTLTIGMSFPLYDIRISKRLFIWTRFKFPPICYLNFVRSINMPSIGLYYIVIVELSVLRGFVWPIYLYSLPFTCQIFEKEEKHIFAISLIIPRYWHDTGSWNPSSSKTKTYLFHIVNDTKLNRIDSVPAR